MSNKEQTMIDHLNGQIKLLQTQISIAKQTCGEILAYNLDVKTGNALLTADLKEARDHVALLQKDEAKWAEQNKEVERLNRVVAALDAEVNRLKALLNPPVENNDGA